VISSGIADGLMAGEADCELSMVVGKKGPRRQMGDGKGGRRALGKIWEKVQITSRLVGGGTQYREGDPRYAKKGDIWRGKERNLNYKEREEYKGKKAIRGGGRLRRVTSERESTANPESAPS